VVGPKENGDIEEVVLEVRFSNIIRSILGAAKSWWINAEQHRKGQQMIIPANSTTSLTWSVTFSAVVCFSAAISPLKDVKCNRNAKSELVPVY
jgi:hypothetical protein